MLGTAFPADRLLLVEQPGPWGRRGLLESHLDPAAAAALVRAGEAHGVRVLAVRRPGRSPLSGGRRWAYADCRLGQEQLWWGHYATDADLVAASVELLSRAVPGDVGLVASTEPDYLVCTHGSHDACCALRGRPIAAALDMRRPGQVWECSHVGGDRFAANVLALPSGLVYGSVRVGELDELIAVTERGEALIEPMRGKVGLPPAVQAALARMHAEWAGPIAGYRTGAAQPAGEGLESVRVTAGERSATVLVQVERSAVHRLTCQMMTPSTVLIYRPVSVSRD